MSHGAYSRKKHAGCGPVPVITVLPAIWQMMRGALDIDA
jgi:hypothetical protein